jgi:hypothetical protein
MSFESVHRRDGLGSPFGDDHRMDIAENTKGLILRKSALCKNYHKLFEA